MKILIISQYFWPESFRINDLAEALKYRGHEVSVLTGLPNYPSGKIFEGFGLFSCGKNQYKGVTVFRVPLLARRQGKSWQLVVNYLSFVFSACLMGPFMCLGKYDILFVYEPSPFTVGIPGILLRYLKKTPMFFWVQDLWPESLSATGAVRSARLLDCVRKMVKFIYKRCDRVLIQSKEFFDPVVAAGADTDAIKYFPNWAESLYQPVTIEANAPERKEIPPGFCIMFAGNLGAAQSLEVIISAARKLKIRSDIHWVIIGDGRRESWLHEKIAEYGLDENVHLIGRRPVGLMPRYFSLADALLVSLRQDPIFSLTIPSKIQSYMACGRPLVASLDGAAANILLESRGGLAAPAGDVDGLVDRVLRIYKMSPSERQKMGVRARSYFEAHFERDKLVDKLEKMMCEVVEERACVF